MASLVDKFSKATQKKAVAQNYAAPITRASVVVKPPVTQKSAPIPGKKALNPAPATGGGNLRAASFLGNLGQGIARVLTANNPVASAAVAVAPRVAQNPTVRQNVSALGRLGANIIGGAARGIGNAVSSEVQRWGRQGPIASLTLPARVAAGVERSIIRPAIQGVGRAAVTLLASPATSVVAPGLEQRAFTPRGPVQQYLLGTEPIRPTGQQISRTRETAEQLGFTPGFARTFAPLGVIGAGILDIAPDPSDLAAGSARRGVREVAEETAARSAREAAERIAREEAETIAGRGVREGTETLVEGAGDRVARAIRGKLDEGITTAEKRATPVARRSAERRVVDNVGSRLVDDVAARNIDELTTRAVDETATRIGRTLTDNEIGAIRRSVTETIEQAPPVPVRPPTARTVAPTPVAPIRRGFTEAAPVRPPAAVAPIVPTPTQATLPGLTAPQTRRVARPTTPVITPQAPVGAAAPVSERTLKPGSVAQPIREGGKNVITTPLEMPVGRGRKAAGTGNMVVSRPPTSTGGFSGGIPGAPEIGVPQVGGKERGFITTVKESPTSAPEVAARVSGRYDPLANKQLLATAREQIDTDPQNALARALGRDVTDDATEVNAVAQTLMKDAQERGDFDTAIKLAEAAAERGTKLGQAVQAYSLWGRMTPEGALRYAQNLIAKANKLTGGRGQVELTEEAARTITEQADRVTRISGLIDEADDLVEKGDFDGAVERYLQIGQEGSQSDVTKILSGADSFGKDAVSVSSLADAAKRQQLFDSAILARETQSVVPAGLLKKLGTYQTMSLLLNGKTMLRNLLGNAGLQAAEFASDTVASGIDVLASLASGRRTKGLPSLRPQMQGFKKGLREGVAEARQGINLRGITSPYDLNTSGGFTFKNPVLRAAEKTLNTAMAAPDRAFFEAAYEGVVDELKRLYRTDIVTKEMHETAVATGLYRTFQDPTKLANALQGVKKALNLGQDFGVGDAVIKFPKTPANILNRGLAYSPAGFARAVFELTKPVLPSVLGGGKGFNQRAFSEATARALVGTAGLVGTGYALSKLGIITGKKPEDVDIAQTRRETGLGEYRLNISALQRFMLSGFNTNEAKSRNGDTTISYEWFQPAALPLALGANINQNGGKDKGVFGALAKAAESDSYNPLLGAIVESMNIVEDQPMLVGLKRLFERNSVPEGIVETLKAVPASFIPTLVNQVRQTIDPYSRETSDPNALKAAGNAVANRIPGVSQYLPKRYTTFGEEKKAYPAGNDPASVFITPWSTDKIRLTPEAAMVLGIYDSAGLTEQAPRLIGSTFDAMGVNFKLSGEQRQEMQRVAGTATQRIFSQLAQNPEFMKLTEEDRAKFLANALTDVNAVARVRPYLDYMETPYPEGVPLQAVKDLVDDVRKDKRWNSLTEEQQRVVIRNAVGQLHAPTQ